ncbi:Cobalamin biosynthesis protein CobD [uncultured delta proteobacterium]|uniref:Cobalamin biosynthesis protein CobD n=1 Tax=uncultured delta proteobacterium TaxID=34034 RepID=A0A212JDT0_9DELT|nr:Cobalamin biosynthesis protein CobD [uncultured delta proteobacterium]
MSCAEFFFPFADLAVYWWLPVTAILLDRCIGDPPRWPHPVRCIGTLLAVVEPRARRLPLPERIAGIFAVLAVLFLTWACARLLLLFPSVFALLFAVYLAFAGLALGQLLREGKAALALLEQNDVAAARTAIGMLVSRDVTRADHDTLCRTLAETLAENFNDAFIAPLFWLVIGGPVGLWLYKAASTMDSVWGYPHEPWTRFGTAAARLDDALAFIPARLTAFFLYCNAMVGAKRNAWPENGLEKPSWPGFARVARDARTMKSPNAGWPMAVCAWIHHAAMGGRAVYAGKAVDKPVLGPPGTVWTTAKLRGLYQALAMTGWGAAALLWAGALLFRLFAS